ncbi:SDR family oxidoreductase [Pelagibacterium halotolerans]|uniref:SDR family oxidoreductase n=1 Tax=Pelagibacterium halotolerans TaxID=531813 RepID=UPI00384C576E
MKKAVVLGGYGFIGQACMRALRAAGYEVTGVGRSRAAAAQCTLDVSWVFADIATATVDDWKQIFRGASVVVNASGVLQDGSKDSLSVIHDVAVGNMLDALAGSDVRFIQISAAGAGAGAATEFFRSKARGDARVQRSEIDWIVLRPVLVFGAQAYGGTALLRAAAAMPMVEPVVFENAPMQAIHVDDLAAAVVTAASGALGTQFVADLAERDSRAFREVVRTVRAWLGYPEWRYAIPIPRGLVGLAGRVADGLGWLGWRSALRTTSLKSLETGIVGNPGEWIERGGSPFPAFDDTLRAIPATNQERVFARAQLILPIMIAVLSIFWVLSGAIGLWAYDRAVAVLTGSGVSQALSGTVVSVGALIDIALGVAVLKRSWSRYAAVGMVLVSVAYLLGATLFAPGLWADPLGPLLKVLPSIVLALTVAMLIEVR